MLRPSGERLIDVSSNFAAPGLQLQTSAQLLLRVTVKHLTLHRSRVPGLRGFPILTLTASFPLSPVRARLRSQWWALDADRRIRGSPDQ